MNALAALCLMTRAGPLADDYKLEVHEPVGNPNRFDLAEFKPPKK